MKLAGLFWLGGSFHVNSCKNIIRPVIPDRLPPLKTAATGEGMGVHINLQRIHRLQRQADKQAYLACFTSPQLGARELAAQSEELSDNQYMPYTGI